MYNTLILFPEGREKALTLSYDDGVEQDKKLIEILNRYGVKATFNLNTGCYVEEGFKFPEGQIHRRMSYSEVTKTYKDSGHEVAVHGYTHPWLDQMPEGMAAYEIVEDRKRLEEQFGVIVRGMAYPFGTYNDKVVETIRNAGIVYSRTIASTHDFYLPTDWLRLATTCHHDDSELMNLAHKFIDTKPFANPYLFYLWGHSYEFEANDNWNVIEEFLEYVSGHDDVWYATNIEIHDYIEAYRSLQFSYDLRRVKNPTAIKIWFKTEFKQYVVEPGQTIEL